MSLLCECGHEWWRHRGGCFARSRDPRLEFCHCTERSEDFNDEDDDDLCLRCRQPKADGPPGRWLCSECTRERNTPPYDTEDDATTVPLEHLRWLAGEDVPPPGPAHALIAAVNGRSVTLPMGNRVTEAQVQAAIDQVAPEMRGRIAVPRPQSTRFRPEPTGCRAHYNDAFNCELEPGHTGRHVSTFMGERFSWTGIPMPGGEHMYIPRSARPLRPETPSLVERIAIRAMDVAAQGMLAVHRAQFRVLQALGIEPVPQPELMMQPMPSPDEGIESVERLRDAVPDLPSRIEEIIERAPEEEREAMRSIAASVVESMQSEHTISIDQAARDFLGRMAALHPPPPRVAPCGHSMQAQWVDITGGISWCQACEDEKPKPIDMSQAAVARRRRGDYRHLELQWMMAILRFGLALQELLFAGWSDPGNVEMELDIGLCRCCPVQRPLGVLIGAPVVECIATRRRHAFVNGAWLLVETSATVARVERALVAGELDVGTHGLPID